MAKLVKVAVSTVIDEVTLKLTGEEAATLRLITSRIGGPPRGRRGHMDSINQALHEAGVEQADPKLIDEQHRSIYFDDEV